MKESSTRNIKIIYRGSTSADRQSKARDEERRWFGDKLKEEGLMLEARLDFRDQAIRVPFTFTVSKDAYNGNPAAYEELILEWLVNVVETIFSVTFRQLLEEKLSLEEGKAWACKNVLLNIKALCEYLSLEVGVGVDERFLQQLDNSLSEIISVVIVKYPQTNAKTASKKVLKLIKQISDRDNDQFDFLFTRNLSIRYHNNADYSTEIMTVINSLLNIPIESANEDESQMESFTKFCKQLFYYSRSDFSNMKQSATFKIVDESIDNILSNNVSPSLEQLDNLAAHRNKGEAYKDLATALVSESYEVTEDLAAFQRTKGHLFRIGQKIPSEVRQFSEKEAKEGQFKVYHAAILRVLTKWSQELHQKLEKAGDLIRARIHKFKTNADGLRFCSVEEKQYLYEEAVREKARVDQYLQALKDQNKILQSVFASEHVQGKFIRKFTNVDVFAGKLEEVVAQYTFRYLNRLVHSLLSLSITAGQRLYQNYKYLQNQQETAMRYLKELGEVNLVTLKVGDLLRARYSCEEHEFVNVLGLLYKMQEIDPAYFRIVKIKNRMFEKDNDILINFFFRSRVICELQLSIHKEENKKQRMYSDFNHFIYELKRSQFGIIAEFASIVAQHDQIVNYFTFNQHSPPIVIEGLKKPSMHLRSRSKQLHFRRKFSDGSYITHKLIEKSIQRPFLCSRCRHLKTVLNPKFYYRQQNELYCNECIQQQLQKSPTLYLLILKELFKYYIIDELLLPFLSQVTLWNPAEELKVVRDEKQLYAAFIDYGFVIEKGDKVPRVRFFKTFINSMDNSVVLSTVINGEIDNFLFLDCKKDKNKYIFYNTLNKYLFFSPKSINQDDLVAMRSFISQENCQQDYLKTIHLKEKQFLKKEYIRTILKSFEKYHTTLYLNGYKYILEYVYEYLHGSNEALTSKRRSLFDGNARRITSLLLQSSQIFTLYPFLTYFCNLHQLDLSSNQITSIQLVQGFKQLQSLNISRNHIPSIEPLTKMPWLDTLIARSNQIASLKDVSMIRSLRVLDCSENKLTRIIDLRGLAYLQELTLNKNIIQSLQGVEHLSKLRILSASQNNLSKLEYVSDLQHLQVLEVASNFISEMVPLPKSTYLVTLNLSNNAIRCIVQLQTKSVKQLNLSENLIKKMENINSLNDLCTLNLARNQLEKIEGLQGLDKLRKLILNDNQIRFIENVEHLKCLQHLKIQNNPINSISNIASLKALTSLTFENCQLIAISQLNSLKKLKSLSLANNNISCIKDVDELVRLQRLDLSHNNIQRIQNLGSLKYLQNISLANNQITKMEGLSQLLDLNWLILSNNAITAIEGLEGLTELKVLELEGNSIQTISGLASQAELEELIISSNKIQKISGLEPLVNLKKLSLSNNSITAFDGLAELGRLQLLDLQMNAIQKIQNLGGLVELKWLVLSLNRIQRIQGLEKLEQLSKLILSHNLIAKIENLSQLKVLTALYLDENQLTKIEGLEDMQTMEKLHLGSNKIGVIEGLDGLQHLAQLNLQTNCIQKIEGLHFLLKLKKLTLAGNCIKVIENVQNLKEMVYFNVSSNQIEQIEAINTLPYLQYIDITNNPINVNDTSSIGKLNENVKLCIELIMQKFDSEILKRTNHKHNSIQPDNKQGQQGKEKKEGKELTQKVKIIRSFAKSFRPQL